MSEKTRKVLVHWSEETTHERIADLLCCGFEGGVNYWCQIVGFKEPDKVERQAYPDRLYKHLDYPMNPGGQVIIKACDEKTRRVLDLAAIDRGLQVMANKYPRHFANWLAENDDAETGDVFIQCCVLGEVVYG